MSERAEWNLEELRQLIDLLRQSNVSEFELRKADYRLRIKQGIAVEESAASGSRRVPVNGEQQEPASEESAVEQIAAEVQRIHEIRSPIVGTFYRSASPGSAPFVEIGSQVQKNQVLCIVEAMKIMNEIESDVDGEILQIHAANGHPVEFGELLFTMKRAS
ncbi:MAG TPA: acetyl-CoA carboxylase biotin carboxyl carrier protein [Acidobacteriota bacterium]|nr:acetyl-CoA carboxylase biotin carboxyl carrier protein [Acidobacteriota bacterium]